MLFLFISVFPESKMPNIVCQNCLQLIFRVFLNTRPADRIFFIFLLCIIYYLYYSDWQFQNQNESISWSLEGVFMIFTTDFVAIWNLYQSRKLSILIKLLLVCLFVCLWLIIFLLQHIYLNFLKHIYSDWL